MLTEQEKRYLLHFFSTLKSEKKIKSISATVTGGKLHCRTREEAVQCILMHAESVNVILQAKGVTANIIFEYLHGLKVEVPGSADKATLIFYLLRTWGLPNSSNSLPDTPIIPTFPQNGSQLANQPSQMNGVSASSMQQPQSFISAQQSAPSVNQPVLNLGSSGVFQGNSQQMNQSHPHMQNGNQPFMTAQPTMPSLNQQVPGNIPMQQTIYDTNQPTQNIYNPYTPQQNLPAIDTRPNAYQYNPNQFPSNNYQNAGQMVPQYTPPYAAVQPQLAVQKSSESPYEQVIKTHHQLKEVNTLAFDDFLMNFAKLFYELFNQNASGQYLHGLNESHFFNECKVNITIKGSHEDIEQASENLPDVLKLLSDLRREHQLMFSPNLNADGVRGKSDSHGLIFAVAGGTLHQGRGQMVGVFEQSFILRKDPFDQNSCKIVETTLVLRSSNAVTSVSQLMLTSNKRTHNNLAIENSSSNHREPERDLPQITYAD